MGLFSQPVASFATGMLAGEKASRDKATEQERERDKESLKLFTDLINQGYTPIDESKGSPTGKVVMIPKIGMLVPPAVDKGKLYDLEKQAVEGKIALGNKEFEYKTKENEDATKLKIKQIENAELERDYLIKHGADNATIAKADLAVKNAEIKLYGLKADEVRKAQDVVYVTDMTTGLRKQLSRQQADQLIASAPTRFQEGEPTSMSARPSSPISDKDAEEERRKQIKERLTYEGGLESNDKKVQNKQTYLDGFIAFSNDPGVKHAYLLDGSTTKRINLPRIVIGKMNSDGSVDSPKAQKQITMADVHETMKNNRMSYQQVLNHMAKMWPNWADSEDYIIQK